MTKNRRKFTAEQKTEIVRRHLKDKTPISSLAEELAIQPTQIYQWVAMLFDQAPRVFQKSENGKPSSAKTTQEIADLKDQKIKRLEAKLVDKK